MKTFLKFCLSILVLAPGALAQNNINYKFVLPDCDLFGNPITAGCPGYSPYLYSYLPYAPTFSKTEWKQFPKSIQAHPADEPGVNTFHMDPQAMLGRQAQLVNQVDTQLDAERKIKQSLPVALSVNTAKPICDTTVKPAERVPASVSPPAPLVVDETAQKDLDSCKSHEVKNIPGSGAYPSHFFEKIVSADKASPPTLFGIGSDTSVSVPQDERGLIVSKSTDGGKTWTKVSQIKKPNYTESDGAYNSLNVTPNGDTIVVTTQKGAFQIPSQTPLEGPIETSGANKGQVKAAIETKINAKGDEMVVSYGFFDKAPELWVYKKEGSNWVKKETLTLPDQANKSQNLSIEYDPNNAHSIYIGTGDQAFHLNPDSQTWVPIAGVRSDSAVRGMYATKDGIYMATCWGAYKPSATKKDSVTLMKSKNFRWKTEDPTGSKIRAYNIEADPDRSNHLIMTASTGVYFSTDAGGTWTRLHDVTEIDSNTFGKKLAEYRTSHFNKDGSVVVSGPVGTFLTNPFSDSCHYSK